MGSHGKRIKIKTYQDNLTDVILTRSFSQRFNLLGYIDTALQIAKNKVFNNFRFCSVIQIYYFCTTNNIKRYEHSISHP